MDLHKTFIRDQIAICLEPWSLYKPPTSSCRQCGFVWKSCLCVTVNLCALLNSLYWMCDIPVIHIREENIMVKVS